MDSPLVDYIMYTSNIELKQCVVKIDNLQNVVIIIIIIKIVMCTKSENRGLYRLVPLHLVCWYLCPLVLLSFVIYILWFLYPLVPVSFVPSVLWPSLFVLIYMFFGRSVSLVPMSFRLFVL